MYDLTAKGVRVKEINASYSLGEDDYINWYWLLNAVDSEKAFDLMFGGME